MSIFGLFEKNDKEVKDLSNKTLRVQKARCPQNHKCPAVRVCPVDALSQNKFEAPKIDLKKCIKCGKCVRYCPTRALGFE